MKLVKDLKAGLKRMWMLQNIWGNPSIGKGTRTGAFVDIGRQVVMGTNCKIQCHVSIPPGWTIGNNVFIGPGVHFANDKNMDGVLSRGYVHDNVKIGMGALILPVTIGKNAVIGAGALVTKDVPEGETWIGNPAKKYG